MQSGKISLALGGAKKAPPPKPSNGVKRSHASLGEDDEQDHYLDRPQKVSHFDSRVGGAVDESDVKVQQPLIIAAQANQDWREASKSRRQRSGLPTQLHDAGEANDVALAERERNLNKPRHGLNITKRGAGNGHDESAAERRSPGGQEPEASGRPVQAAAREQAAAASGGVSANLSTDEDEAVAALLGRTKQSDLVLPAVSDEEAFSQDFRNAPSMATLDDYDRVPVEQFGAALLRGMGWKDGEGIGSERGIKATATKTPQRRPALLGIGAKEEAAVAQELGSWGKGVKDRKGGVPQVYNPVLLRDKKTGQMFTEEELQKKKEREERERYEEEFDRKQARKRREDGKEDEGHRRKEGEGKQERNRRDQRDSRDTRRRDDSDEDRHSRRRDRHRDRQRKRHDGDRDYYRREEKERSRRDRDREVDDSEHDRQHTRRPDRDRYRHRDRHSERESRR